jgi:carbon storage regulator
LKPTHGYTFQLTEELPMLVLTRKAGETIRIADNIVVTVLEVEGHRVRLGIAAPSDVPIRRAELPLRCAKPAGSGVLPLGTRASESA